LLNSTPGTQRLNARIDEPDRVIFDLDPGEGVSWAQIQEAAVLMRPLLSDLALDAWLKTSGGKGLHLVVPLAPKLSYDVVKGFSQAAVQHMSKVRPGSACRFRTPTPGRATGKASRA
jgi:bifunctional non-homologous end joining protein LigD